MATKTENVTGERQVPIRLSPCVDYPISVTEQSILFFLIRLFCFFKERMANHHFLQYPALFNNNSKAAKIFCRQHFI